MLRVEYRCDVGRTAFASASKSPIAKERDESAPTNGLFASLSPPSSSSSSSSLASSDYGPQRRPPRQQRRHDLACSLHDGVLDDFNGEAAARGARQGYGVVTERVFVVSGGKRFLRTRRAIAEALVEHGVSEMAAAATACEPATDPSLEPNDDSSRERPPLVFVEVSDTAVAESLGSPRDLLPPRITPPFDPTDALPFPFRTNLSRQNTMRTYHEQEEYYRRRRAWIRLQDEKAVAPPPKSLVASLWTDDATATAAAAATADPAHCEFAEACWRPESDGDGGDDEKTTCESDERRESKVERRPSASAIARTATKKPPPSGRRSQTGASVAESPPTTTTTTTASGRRATRSRQSATKPELPSSFLATRTRPLVAAYHEGGAVLVGADPRLRDMKNAVILTERLLTRSPPKPTADDATLLARFVPRCVGTPRVMRAAVDCADSHLLERAHLGSVFLVTAGAWAGLLVCVHSLCLRYRTLPSLAASTYRLPEYVGADELRDHDVRLGGGGGGDARWRTNRALMEHLRRCNAIEAYERESFDPELAELYPHYLSSSCARNHAIRCALTGVCVRCEVVGVVSGARYYAKPYYVDSAPHSPSSSSSFSSSSVAPPATGSHLVALSPAAAPSSFSIPSPTLVEDACVVVDLQHLSLHLGAEIVSHAFSASLSPFSDEYRPRPLPPYLDAYDFSD